ncbi:adenosylcobinamide-phosphate synthase CbiB [Leptolyngbya ohadii]|uniref:adenosylcobinamide-phosphate synthase CbiB n=1 Tax=Leptolyngbya ohadii TaxID=1962290 RepID=UPI000B59E9EC|nr:adenosylcobinamide-phosphate synthase CbiB [Leptolyngbya ohadii]
MPFASIVLIGAAGLDYWIGDPWGWLHPVQVMGWGIQQYSQWALKLKPPIAQKIAGVGLAIGLISLSGFVGWLIVTGATLLNLWFGIITAIVLLASCFAGRSLRRAAGDVLAPLQAGDLEMARSRLSLYVGRDTADLDEAEIRRAVLETVTENAVDGVLAPLFFALVGSLLPVGAVPLALAYKAASTLDSMVGYREAPYTHLGWCSARLEDYLTWIPCRLTVLTLALLSGQPGRVWQICRRDAPQDPSPNAGWSECAYAVVLGVQVGGKNQYRGVVKNKPLLGDPVYPITVDRIHQAMNWTRRVFLLWLTIGLAAILFPIAVNSLTRGFTA